VGKGELEEREDSEEWEEWEGMDIRGKEGGCTIGSGGGRPWRGDLSPSFKGGWKALVLPPAE